jgi:glycosyltransferase involved in cell wall biosynthesis
MGFSKFLIVAHYFVPHPGGIEIVAQKQAQSLQQKGHEVTVMTCRFDRQQPLAATDAHVKIKRLRSINIIEKKFGVTFPVISPHNLWRFFKQVKKHDVVHIHDVFYMTSHLAALACLLAGKPFFLTQHVALVDHPTPLVMMMQKVVYATFGRLLFTKAVAIVAYNQNVKDFLLSQGVAESKILLTNNGIDTDYFSPLPAQKRTALRQKYGLPADKPIVLFVGRLVPKKGFDLVFDAATPKHFTLLVGNGNVPSRMQNTKEVRFFGPASQAQLRDLYRISDIFVFPAIGEIFTLTMQEAMASGLPIIATNDAAYRRYNLDPQRLLLVKRDAKSLSASIKKILTSPALHKKMSTYSRTLALQQFSWGQNYKNEYKIYQQVLR